ncbi:MAG: nicotinate-nucleotide adenylyltransferase [Bacillales bacterium]|jgi:nicotinate-nucleotide adenylyltransferase|nr:nicotinate-nucleotide adenylyltransferase [Bacillales bacterium]
MRKVGILGGAFDPPHNGHLLIAEAALKQLSLDEIRFIPTNIPPHKQASFATAVERIEMLRLAIETANTNKYVIDSIELNRNGPSYTIDTVTDILEKEPETKFFFIIGGDMIDYLPHWHRIDELVQCITFVGVPRPSYNGVTKYSVQMLDMDDIDISSSDIRRKIQTGIAVDEYLPKSVLNFIKGNGLYGI